LTALAVLLIGITAVATIPYSAFEEALCCIPLPGTDRILAAIRLGLEQEGFSAEDVLRLIERLVDHPAPAPDKEGVLLTLAAALEEGLPVDGLLGKAFEGLVRGVPLAQIDSGLHQRLILLIEVRDLLYAKGIFSVPSGSPQSVPSALPTLRFNELLTNISDVVGDHLEGGGSPFDGHVLSQEMQERLIALQGATLLRADVELVLERIEPTDLTHVALAAVS
jgi:hypothetical protein